MQAVILVGIQGAGKTTFYQQRFADTHAHISLDVVGTRNREQQRLAECLAAHQPFVIDNTNVAAADRRPYIEAAARAGYRVVGYFFDTALKPTIERNGKRADKKVPVPALVRAFKRLEPPQRSEGFDELNRVTLGADNRFTVAEYAAPDPDPR